jgi:carbon starvation protein CstA
MNTAFWLSFISSLVSAYLGVISLIQKDDALAVVFGLVFLALLALAAVVDATPLEGFAQRELDQRGQR